MGNTYSKASHRSLFTVLLTGILLVPLIGNAQLREMDISMIEDPADRFMVFTEHPNEAYIIIQSTINNLVFTSNMDGIVEDRSEPDQGRYILIVRPFTQIFTVNAPGYMVGRFRVQSPQARNSYHYRIRPVEATTEFIPVNFIVDQVGAELFVNNQEVPVGQTVRLEPGPQQVRIERAGYRTITDEIVISHDNTLFQYRMEELFEIPVTIRSNPPGATVYINTVRQNRETNFQDFFYPGEYLVRVSMSGYRDAEKQIQVTEDGTNDFLLELERFVGTLSLSVEPANSKITINNRDYTGQRDIALSPGVYHIIVERDGFNSFSERVNIVEGEQLTRSIRLQPKTGVLVFSIEQADAEVSLFNQHGELVQQWRGINRIPNLPVGIYQYTATLQGYPQLTGQFTISDNATERVIADFNQVAGEDDVVARLEQQAREMRETTERRVRDQDQQEPATQPEQARPEQARPEPARAQEPVRQPEQTARAEQPSDRDTGRNPFFTPRRFKGFTLGYTDMWLNTDAFKDNVASRWGMTIGTLRTRRFWATTGHLGFGQIHLHEFTASFIVNGPAEDHINVMLYGLKTGPKIGLGPINMYLAFGVEGSVLFHESFENESFGMMDGATEFGLLFLPGSWPIGLRYSVSVPFDTQDDFIQFTRMELGIIIK